MSPSPDAAAEHTSPPPNLGYIYQQQRTRTKPLDALQNRGRNISKYELGRRDRYGERVTRIYPREIAKSPPTTKRYTSTSPGPHAYNATTSPLMAALGTTKSTAAQYTSEWTKSLPFFVNNQHSPNNGIAIPGSPANMHHSPGTPYGQPGVSPSPPPPSMRPLSHPNPYTGFGGRLPASPPHQSSARDRRASMYSQYGAKPFSSNPPLPHQPQPHFYNLPDLDLGLNNNNVEGITPGEGGYFCGFDTLAMAGDEPSKSAQNVLLVGYEGGIDIFRLERSRMDVIGRLEGLKGSVLGAKILHWTARRDPLSASRPLIALVIHGPIINESKDGQNSSDSSSVVDDTSQSPSRPGSSRGTKDSTSIITHYQTTVEVYSLKQKEKIATLYKSPAIQINASIDAPMFEPPPPAGDFVLDAKGKFVTVACGASGEVFIFAPYLEKRPDHPEQFRCIGKVWTSVLFRDRIPNSSASSATEGNGHEGEKPEQYGVPIFSLSERWLAVTPPPSTSLFPVNGVALTSATHERPLGLAHHTVPPQPTASCAVDAPESDSLVNRLAREGTQVAIKGAQWATAKGIQAFKSYMGKNTPANGNISGGVYGDPMQQQQQQQYFPPSHAHNHAQPRDETTVISIYDLQKLFDAEETRNKNALHPISTIPAVHGCSYLSFSVGGLMLLTVSRKGDLQDVWDLKRINFRKNRKSGRDAPSGPHVRQVTRFARMTVTNVVDAVWSGPKNDKIAVITDKGTVHMFLMPTSASQWPPPRRTRKTPRPAQSGKQNEVPATGGRGAVNSAMQAINGTAKPFLDAFRIGSNATGGSRMPSLSSLGLTPAAGAKSGKAVAVGVGKQFHQFRHSGDNKLALPTIPSGVKPNSVRWLTGKGRGSIALVSGGVLQIYRVQMRPATGKGKSGSATSISKKKMVEFGLAPVRDTVLPPVVQAIISAPSDERVLDAPDIHGEWLPRALPSRRRPSGHYTARPMASEAPLSYAEIETNPPYQPFYTDRRVTRFVFARHAPADLQYSQTTSQADLQQTQHSLYQSAASPELVSNLHDKNDASEWLFGDSVEAVRLSSPAGPAFDHDGEDPYAGDDIGELASRLQNNWTLRRGDGDDELGQVIVTTTRRRVRNENGEAGEDGFFEDDCEVLDYAEDRV